MSKLNFERRSEEAKRCIYPVIRHLNSIGAGAYGGRYYDGDMNVLHVNITDDIRGSLSCDAIMGEELPNLDKHIVYHKVKYSEGQLKQFQRIFDAEMMGKLGVTYTAPDIKLNKLLIGVEDNSEEAVEELRRAIEKLGYVAADMYKIIKRARSTSAGTLDFTGNPVDMSNGIPDRVIDAAAAANILVAPGSWIGNGPSKTNILGISSLCTGFYYNNQPGFLSCGHGKSVGQKIFYWPAPSSSGYSNIHGYSSSNLVELGTIAAVGWNSGDAFDYASIRRTNTSAYMNPQNFCGGTIDGDSGIPEIGERMAVCGCADGAFFAECSNTSATTLVDNTIWKVDMLEMEKRATDGTSGGSVAYLDDETGKVNLTGIVTSSSNNTNHSYHAKYSLVKNAFNLTTVY